MIQTVVFMMIVIFGQTKQNNLKDLLILLLRTTPPSTAPCFPGIGHFSRPHPFRNPPFNLA
jgi:hypothetical protein